MDAEDLVLRLSMNAPLSRLAASRGLAQERSSGYAMCISIALGKMACQAPRGRILMEKGPGSASRQRGMAYSPVVDGIPLLTRLDEGGNVSFPMGMKCSPGGMKSRAYVHYKEGGERRIPRGNAAFTVGMRR